MDWTCHLISLFLEIDFAEFEDHCKIDGLYTHAAWFLIEVFLLEDLRARVNKQIHQNTASQTNRNTQRRPQQQPTDYSHKQTPENDSVTEGIKSNSGRESSIGKGSQSSTTAL